MASSEAVTSQPPNTIPQRQALQHMTEGDTNIQCLTVAEGNVNEQINVC